MKEWLYQLLCEDYTMVRSPRSYNSQIGVPLSVWEINEQTELAVIEAGISKSGEMDKLEPIVQPTVGFLPMWEKRIRKDSPPYRRNARKNCRFSAVPMRLFMTEMIRS